jgi:hypothetical protein
MFKWYSEATLCIAFLEDVPDEVDPLRTGSLFPKSKWFKRGWTLQELVAPRTVIFVSQGWQPLGTKAGLASTIKDITGIDLDVLCHQRSPRDVSVARRMSWAAQRETTRVEDEAYSLLGIFEVNMPTIYGEGHGAFRRLQEEILRSSVDYTLFAWLYAKRRSQLSFSRGRLFANSPREFADASDTETFSLQNYKEAFNAFTSAAASVHGPSSYVVCQLQVLDFIIVLIRIAWLLSGQRPCLRFRRLQLPVMAYAVISRLYSLQLTQPLQSPSSHASSSLAST